MTLVELLHVLRRYWKWIVIPTILVTVAAGAYGYLKPKTYKASASAVLSGYTSFIGAIADQEAQSGDFDSAISVSTNSSSGVVTITATGSDADSCVAEANYIVDLLADIAFEQIPTTEVQQTPTVIEAYAEEATTTGKGVKFYVMLGFVGALFVTLCAVLVGYYVRGYVSCVAAEQATGLPLLEALPVSDGGSRLKANVEFTAGKQPMSLCVVPVGAGVDAASVVALLDGAAAGASAGAGASDSGENPEAAASAVITAAPAVSSDISAVYTARDAEATVLLVKEFASTTTDLDLTMRELKLAKANVIGYVYEQQA